MVVFVPSFRPGVFRTQNSGFAVVTAKHAALLGKNNYLCVTTGSVDTGICRNLAWIQRMGTTARRGHKPVGKNTRKNGKVKVGPDLGTDA